MQEMWTTGFRYSKDGCGDTGESWREMSGAAMVPREGEYISQV